MCREIVFMESIEGKKGSAPESHHPFGGCNNLLKNYQTIGNALMKFESRGSAFGSYRDFRVGVAFVPLEVLESYLDDLLDLEVSEEKLCIYKEKSRLNSFNLALVGSMGSIGLGIFAASAGASFLLSFLLTLCLAFPFAILWHFSPREGAARRMRFAQVVSNEVARRRGNGKGPQDRSSHLLGLGELISKKTSGSTQGAAFDIIPPANENSRF